MTAPAKQRLRAVAGYFADTEAADADRLMHDRLRLGNRALLAEAGVDAAAYAKLLAAGVASEGGSPPNGEEE